MKMQFQKDLAAHHLSQGLVQKLEAHLKENSVKKTMLKEERIRKGQ